MTEKTKNSETKILTGIFFIILLVSIFFVSKMTLTALGIYSSVTYSIAYFALFGVAYIFTKYVFISMLRTYQYIALAISAAISGVCIIWLLYLH